MAPTPLFEIAGLEVRATDGPAILHGVDLTIQPGEVHAIMGPNGSGKSTLATSILGSPEYEVTGGQLLFQGDDITDWDTDVRAKAGIFLAFQYPQEISGVSVRNFLRQAVSARKGEEVSTIEVYIAMQNWMERLEMDPSFMDRYLNEGFSGGEKKRCEVLQLSLLRPELAILDETDSGLDVDAIRLVGSAVNRMRSPEVSALLITHYMRILEAVRPDRVHVMFGGQVVRSAGPELAAELEAGGYDSLRAEAGAAAAPEQA